MNRESNLLYHFVAFVTVAIWGTTFVWTKLLIQNGLSPAQIFTIRFLIAYVMLLRTDDGGIGRYRRFSVFPHRKRGNVIYYGHQHLAHRLLMPALRYAIACRRV